MRLCCHDRFIRTGAGLSNCIAKATCGGLVRIVPALFLQDRFLVVRDLNLDVFMFFQIVKAEILPLLQFFTHADLL